MAIQFTRGKSEAERWQQREPRVSLSPTEYTAHDYQCPHNRGGYSASTPVQPDCPSQCEPALRVTLFEGLVLDTRERNYYDDSDWYAICWDPEKKCLITYEYATTRFAGSGSARVDASPEVIDEAAAWLEQWLLNKWAEESFYEAREIKVARRVVVTNGRKVPIGYEGVVQWVGKGNYRRERAKIVCPDGEVYWTDARNLKVVDPDQYQQSPELGRQFASYYARQKHAWHMWSAHRSGLVVL
jgi:hypothetical protein